MKRVLFRLAQAAVCSLVMGLTLFVCGWFWKSGVAHGASSPLVIALWTAAVGMVIFVVNQFLLKCAIEPVYDLRRFRGDIVDILAFYANQYCNPGCGEKEDMEAASDALRQAATKLLGRRYAIPWYPLWSGLRMVPKNQGVMSARENLTGLSNSVSRGKSEENNERARAILVALDLPGVAGAI